MFSHLRRSSKPPARSRQRRSAGLPSDLNSQPAAPLSESVLALQRSHGNQFVQRLLNGQVNTAQPARIQRTPDEAKQKREIIERIEKTYGIKMDDQAGIKALNKMYFMPDKKDANLLNLTPVAWSLTELQALEDVLKQYAPILGANRAGSTVTGAQGVTTFSRVNTSLKFSDGEFDGSADIDSIMSAKGLDEKQLETIASLTEVQAVAIGIDKADWAKIKDALPRWKARNDAVKKGKAARMGSASDIHVLKDASTLGQTFSGDKNISLFDKMTTSDSTFKGDIPKSMRQTIAHELAHALIQGENLARFVTTFSDYWVDASTRVSGRNRIAAETVEAPITWYGGNTAKEDLAETAGFYFVDPDILTKGNRDIDQNVTGKKGMPGNPAPRRKAFMERVVAEWTSAPIKEFGVKSDAVLKLKDSQTLPQVEAAYTAAEAAYKALSPDDKKKVDSQHKAMTDHYNAVAQAVKKKAAVEPAK